MVLTVIFVLLALALLALNGFLLRQVHTLPDKVRPKPPADIVTRKCRCYRDYHYHVHDKDPGECPQCKIRKG